MLERIRSINRQKYSEELRLTHATYRPAKLCVVASKT
jgi:hypothetical protein